MSLKSTTRNSVNFHSLHSPAPQSNTIKMGATESGGASPFPQTSTPQNGMANDIPMEQRKRKICVYCGSSAGKKPEHMEAARQLAKVMAENNIGLGESTFPRLLRPPPGPLTLSFHKPMSQTDSLSQYMAAAQSGSWARLHALSSP